MATRKGYRDYQHYCKGCDKEFLSSRAITSHWLQNKECSEFCHHTDQAQQHPMYYNEESYHNDSDLDETSAIHYDTQADFENADNGNTEQPFYQNEQQEQTLEGSNGNKIGYNDNTDNSLPAKIELLKMLNTAKAPLYLYEQIIAWAKTAVNKYDVDFGVETNFSREKLLQELKSKYSLKLIEPKVQKLTLRGSLNTTDIITHSFKDSLFSLLNDKQLMQSKNLLISESDIYGLEKNPSNTNSTKVYSDINTGTVYQKAQKEYCKEPNDILCPIIFFIDKTHTDTNGRLCLEPIRFTLGIFNRETRNNPSAWRTMGYISDQAQIEKTTPHQKAIDYHHMIEIIIQEFQQCQQEKVSFKLNFNSKSYNVNLKIPVLYIIGDTEGLDKICGRYTSRNNIQRPCRCCDCPFDKLDDPEYKFKLNNHKKLMKQIEVGSANKLKELSSHKLSNAWENLKFCDPERGLFGAVCGDIMHCLQHGLFMYLITMLFDQKKIKDILSDTETDETSYILSNRSAFPEAYCTKIDSICRKYGKMIMHQSDRSLPRTHFYSSYTTVTRKNASEMSGIILVYLMVFNSNEGASKIDQQLGEGRTTQFICLFELMLLLENFCGQDELSPNMVRTLHQFMPYILNTYKLTLDRQVGCQMKIIKFHLPSHFASDIQRFGSMKNFDTGIGESHHKTESKNPAKNTQRRKVNFEFQAAKRQIENLAINMAYNNSIAAFNDDDEKKHDDYVESKWFRYVYDDKKHVLMQKNSKENCKWIDTIFQNQLEKFCSLVVNQGCIVGPLKFFTQHNRGKFIFRADPSYDKTEPWYDWASIKWEADGIIPAKLLIFWAIGDDAFQKPFKIGSTTITCPGEYAISYSLSTSTTAIRAHGASHLVKYAVIDFEKDICMFPVESIHSPITALPYNIQEDTVIAKEWILLVSKDNWLKIFVELMKSELEKEKSTRTGNKRKSPAS